MTGRVFGDLAVWMVGFGLVIGVVFPFGVTALGIPARAVEKASFVACTISAGLAVTGFSFLLAHRVVGRRLRELSQRMGLVAGAISEATDTGDWSRCSPQECELTVDSADELGEVAASFNGLLYALARSRAVEETMARFSGSLVHHLDVTEVCDVALQGFMANSDASGGLLGVIRDGQLVVWATHHCDADDLTALFNVPDLVSEASAPVVVDVPVAAAPGDDPASGAPPRQAVAVPVRFDGSAVGVVILTLAEPATPETLNFLSSMEAPAAVALNNALNHDRLQHVANFDALTGAYNRGCGDSRLVTEWARAATGGCLGLISFDLDHFKAVNDTYGHLAGDEVLRQVAARARLAMRHGDVLIRTGGDEFLIILPGAGAAAVAATSERMREAVETTAVETTAVETTAVATSDLSPRVTVSMGGLSWPETSANDVDELLAKLDAALYFSKRKGRNRVTMVPSRVPPLER